MNGLTLLAPWGLALGTAVAGALALLHAITVGRPRPAWLPTARFAPDRAPRAVRRLARPADRWLLALRVLAALLGGVALARPVREPARRRVARVVLADVSDSATRAPVRDSVRLLVGPGDALVAFAAAPRPALLVPAGPVSTAADSAARRAALDSTLAAAVPHAGDPTRASLSAALVAARRAAPFLAAADSLELVVVSPFARDAVDAGTAAVRGTWTGRARLVPMGMPAATQTAATHAARARPVALRGDPADDALAAALALAGVGRDDAAPVRVVRAGVSEADRAWAAGPGHALVVWPAGRETDLGGRTAAGADAFVAGGRAAVGAFGRGGAVGPEDVGGALRTVARWADGTPAATERRTGSGCVRTIDVHVPQTGDAALRPGFTAMLPALLGPCGGARDAAPLAPADLARLARAGPLLAAGPLRTPRSSHAPDPLGAALLAAAAALLAELPLRRLLRRPTAADAPAVASDATRETADGPRGASRAAA